MPNTPTFTAEEMAILLDKNFLLTKRVALEKTMSLLAVLSERLQQNPIHQGFEFPKGTDTMVGKISKGENYKGLPYMVLDFPKYFHKTSIFTFRSMFWWGNEYSFTLHLGGDVLLQYQTHLLKQWKKLEQKGVYFCINSTPWEYDFGEDNYLPIEELDRKNIEEKIAKTGFIKLSRQLVLKDWEQLLKYGNETYQLFLECLQES